MKTLKALTQTLTALCLLGLSHLASAGLITFSPTPALGNVGDPISVDLLWTGSPGDYIGDFDVEFFFDSSIADLVSVIIDPDSGLDSLGAGIYDSGPVAGGTYALGISLDAAADVVTNQDSLGNTFRLASFQFLGTGIGQTNLTFGTTTFGDENGATISPTLNNGQICVGPDGCRDAPEPASFLLLGLGLAALGFSGRKRV